MSNQDALAALAQLANSTRPATDKVKTWKTYVKKLDWCDKDECRTEECIDDAIKKLAELGLAMHTTVESKQGGRVSAMGYMDSVLSRQCDHYSAKEIQEFMAASCQSHNCEIVAGPDTPEHLKKLPAIYFNQQRKEYYHHHEGKFYLVDKEAVKTLLVNSGYSAKRGDDLSSSEVDNAMLKIIHTQSVEAAGRFAGYDVGIHDANGLRILATKSFKLVEPIYPGTPQYDETKCETISALLDGLFGQNVAANHVAAYIRQGYLDLKAGRKQGGLCLVAIGPVNCGKSLFAEHVLVPILGGTSGNAAQFMSSKTNFNDTLIGAETWLLDDNNPFGNYEARMAFTDAVKAAVAASTVFCHGKGKAGLSLPLFRRLVVLANDDAIESAPDIAGSMGDKVLLVKANKFTMPSDMIQFPERNDTNDYEKFAAQIKRELPCFLGCILQDEEIGKLCGGRFGVEAWQDPELVKAMETASHLNDQAAIIFRSVFGRSPEVGEDRTMTSTDVWQACHESHEFGKVSDTYWKTPVQMGKTLNKLVGHSAWGKCIGTGGKDGVSRYKLCLTLAALDAISSNYRGKQGVDGELPPVAPLGRTSVRYSPPAV